MRRILSPNAFSPRAPQTPSNTRNSSRNLDKRLTYTGKAGRFSAYGSLPETLERPASAKRAMSGPLVAVRTFDRETLGVASRFRERGSDGIVLQQLGDFLLEHAFRAGADLLIDHLIALDKENRRDVANAELRSDGIVVVHVAFADRHAALLLGGQLVDNRGDRPAGSAPFGPEIDDQRFARIHQGFQIFRGDSKCHIGEF